MSQSKPLLLGALLASAIAIAFGIHYLQSTPDTSQANPEQARPSEASERPARSLQERWEVTESERRAPGPRAEQAAAEAGEARLQRRMEMIEARSQIPVEERARYVAQRWEMSPEQEQAVADIMSRYRNQSAELMNNPDLSDREKVAAQLQLNQQQSRELSPLILASPGMQRSKEAFIEAGEARGGQLVTD